MLNDMMALPIIAYFSMEIALETHIPTYSGGSACWPVIPSAAGPTQGCRWWV
jgi:hypothetical protein